MKELSILIALIVWFVCSLLLVGSVIGLLLFVRADDNATYWQGDKGASTWLRIGFGLMNKLIEK